MNADNNTTSGECAEAQDRWSSAEANLAKKLPRLLYIGDVPVEEMFGGSTLLFRLLSTYPSDRLLCIETNMQSSTVERRLPLVRYERLSVAYPRLLRTRFRSTYESFLLWQAAGRSRQLREAIGGFHPDAVVSVAHGYSWISAYRYAKRTALPFHLIVHDDWRHAVPSTNRFKSAVRHRFATAYREAHTCYCISRYMAEQYAQEFGRKGIELPPLRGDDVVPGEPGHAYARSGLTIAYAGNLHNDGYRELVWRLAKLLPKGCRLLLFSPKADIPSDVASYIEFRAPLPPRELNEALRQEADVLFCPSSFLSEERLAMGINLPSKLAEYTATGVPILVWGPPDSSPVKWARDHSGAALVIDENSDQGALESITQLADQDLRRRFGRTALSVGTSFFSPSRVRRLFYQRLVESVSRQGDKVSSTDPSPRRSQGLVSTN